jgi:hypothetical protein
MLQLGKVSFRADAFEASSCSVQLKVRHLLGCKLVKKEQQR